MEPYSKFKDFKDHFQNSRTFQGFSKIAIEIQGLFKDFKDLSEIQGFQGFFQGCGHPVTFSKIKRYPISAQLYAL